MKNKWTGILIICGVFCWGCGETSDRVFFEECPEEQRIGVYMDGRLFTNFYYSDRMDKQVLYPLYTASGVEITRGYPLNPRPLERVDHVHHYGLWFNFGDVNGIDFWNNSPAIPPERKFKYGSIRFGGILETKPAQGKLVAASDWVHPDGTVLLKEKTTYRFGGNSETRTVRRITELTAQREVVFTENKEGLLGIRVDRAFEEPAENPIQVTGKDGRPMQEKILNNEGVTGVYRNADGIVGSHVWGKRSPWVALRGEKDGQVVTIAILDHPANPGYPAWSHARGYGLFAANNLGGRAFDKGAEEFVVSLKAGQTVTFDHLVVIGGEMTDGELHQWHKNF